MQLNPLLYIGCGVALVSLVAGIFVLVRLIRSEKRPISLVVMFAGACALFLIGLLAICGSQTVTVTVITNLSSGQHEDSM